MAVGLEHGVGGQVRVAAAGLHDVAAGLDDLRGELLGEIGRVGHVRAGRGRRAVRGCRSGRSRPPGASRRGSTSRCRRSSYELRRSQTSAPSYGRLEQGAQRVGQQEAVDQAGRLLAGVGVDRVELGRQQLDVLAGRAQVLGEQALIVGGALSPVVGIAGVGGIAVGAGGGVEQAGSSRSRCPAPARSCGRSRTRQ